MASSDDMGSPSVEGVGCTISSTSASEVEDRLRHLTHPLKGVKRTFLDADSAVHAERPVDGEAVEHMLRTVPRPGGGPSTASVCESMLMHQVGHSRAQIMHDVHAGSINRIHRCDESAELTYASGEPYRRRPTPTSAGTGEGCASSRSPQTAGSGTPGGTSRRRPGVKSASPAPWLPASSFRYARLAPHPYEAGFPQTRD